MKTFQKRAIWFILLTAMLCFPLKAAAVTTNDAFHYQIGNGDLFYIRENSQSTGGFFGYGALPDYKSANDCPWADNQSARSVQNVIFHEGITRIGDNICANMPFLKTAVIYPSLQTISKTAFRDSPLFDTIQFQGKVEEWKAITARSGIDMNRDFPGVYVRFPDGTVYPYSLPGSCSATLSASSFTYTGGKVWPHVTVQDKARGRKLVLNRDYTVACSDNINVGTGRMTITGTGDYTGKIEKSFTITPRVETVKLSTPRTVIRVGESIKIIPETGNPRFYRLYVTQNASHTVVKGNYVKAVIDCTFKITAVSNVKNNCTVKSNTLTIRAVPNVTKSFTAASKDGYTYLTWKKVPCADRYYIYRDGKKIKTLPKSKLNYLDKTGTRNGHRYKYEIVASSPRTGYLRSGKTLYFFYLKRPTLQSVKVNKNTGVIVRWGTNSMCSGYEVEISTDNFKKNIHRYVLRSRSANKHTFKVKYKKGTKIKARVRSFIYKDGKYDYSGWSKTKTVTWK